jgi:hypothetical protein
MTDPDTGRKKVVRSQLRRRTPRQLVPTHRRPERTLGVVATLIIAAVFLSYDVAGIARLQRNPVTGVDYLPVVEFVADRKLGGEKVLVALPPPAYLALGSTEDLIFLSSPIERKRAQRYTRLTGDGRYVDYWAGVDSVVDTAGLCQTLMTEPDLWLIVDHSRLTADWAFAGSMATVIEGMTYVRYAADGGAMVRRLMPLPSRDPRAESICASALTGQFVEPELTEEPAETPTPEP